jgi:pimeloyl-ACP methyl ester carboxylesterase
MSTFCLVSGSTQDPRCWSLLTPEIERRGHRVVTVSLPTDERDAGGMRYAEVIAQTLENVGDDVILVGHSASGMFVPLAASLRPFRRLVYLASLIPQPGFSIRRQIADAPDLLNPEWVAVCQAEKNPFTDDDVATEFLFHDCGPEAVKIGLETRMLMYAQGAMEETFPLPALPSAPSDYIVCADDRTITPAWSRRAARERLGVEAIELPGGHCPYLSRPVALAEILVGLLD